MILAISVLALVSSVLALAFEGPGSRPQQGQATGSTNPVAAKIGKWSISLSDLDADLGSRTHSILRTLYELRRRALDNLIDRHLLELEAARTSTAVESLIEVTADSTDVQSDHAAAEREYLENMDAMAHAGEVTAKYQIAMIQLARKKSAILENYLQTLRKKYNVEVLLEPPELYLKLRPTDCWYGPRNGADLTIFMDYECPFCKRLHDELRRLHSTDSVLSQARISIKHLPIKTHSTSHAAAAAAVCAARQNRFGDVHDALFKNQTHPRETLLSLARESGLDEDSFARCLDSAEAATVITNDIADARRAGVQEIGRAHV